MVRLPGSLGALLFLAELCFFTGLRSGVLFFGFFVLLFAGRFSLLFGFAAGSVCSEASTRVGMSANNINNTTVLSMTELVLICATG